MAIFRQPQDVSKMGAAWHCVATRFPENMRPTSENGIDWTIAGMAEVTDWLDDPLRRGSYTWVGTGVTSTTMGNLRFFFSDEQTAFEFKIRWG